MFLPEIADGISVFVVHDPVALEQLEQFVVTNGITPASANPARAASPADPPRGTFKLDGKDYPTPGTGYRGSLASRTA